MGLKCEMGVEENTGVDENFTTKKMKSIKIR